MCNSVVVNNCDYHHSNQRSYILKIIENKVEFIYPMTYANYAIRKGTRLTRKLQYALQETDYL